MRCPATMRSLATELRAFWPHYLWHHRRPWTRILHQIGSWSIILGAVAAIATGYPWLIPAAIPVGYLFAFAGHWFIEHNQPLTIRRPILAGICNWIMFALELTGRLERHLLQVEEQPREEWDDYGVGSE